MADARLRVRFAGPFVSFQDGGRHGHMRFGVPASGPMDRLSHAAANVALGNEPGVTAIEVSMAGLALECLEGVATVAVAGGGFAVKHGARPLPSWSVCTLRPGDQLTIRVGAWGSWATLAVAGELVAPRWLGHTATHSMSGLGGGALVTGQEILVRNAMVVEKREGEIPPPDIARPTGVSRVVLGPQDQHFVAEALTSFLGSAYELTDAYDRMGVRLRGEPLLLREALSIPSEPIVRGSVQVAGDGVPTLLLADHQTTGGYPKIATVISADLDALTQLRAGDAIEFEAVSPSEAVRLARAHAEQTADYLEAMSRPGRTLEQRLAINNLIGGGVLEDN